MIFTLGERKISFVMNVVLFFCCAKATRGEKEKMLKVDIYYTFKIITLRSHAILFV